MSALLDILHRRAPGRPAVTPAPPAASDPVHTGPDTPESGAAPLELQLAGDPPAGPPAHDEAPGAHLQTGGWHATPDDPLATGGALAGPGEAPAAADTDTWRAAPARQTLRRGTLMLLLGLGAILAGAGAALWQLNPPAGDDILAAPGLAPPPTGEDTFAPIAPITRTAPADPAPALQPEPDPRSTFGGFTPQPAAIDPATDAAGANPLTAADDTARIIITRRPVEAPLHARLTAAWEALRDNDAARAGALYQAVLTEDPDNVDALLGLGTLAARQGDTASARQYHDAVLRLAPRNATAIAALAALEGGTGADEESRLKTLIAQQPEAAALHHALGLHYLAGQRWSDAQAAFFSAVRHAPGNADYAYNLAVSLDRIGQRTAAIAWYRRALALSAGDCHFDTVAAGDRVATLETEG